MTAFHFGSTLLHPRLADGPEQGRRSSVSVPTCSFYRPVCYKVGFAISRLFIRTWLELVEGIVQTVQRLCADTMAHGQLDQMRDDLLSPLKHFYPGDQRPYVLDGLL